MILWFCPLFALQLCQKKFWVTSCAKMKTLIILQWPQNVVKGSHLYVILPSAAMDALPHKLKGAFPNICTPKFENPDVFKDFEFPAYYMLEGLMSRSRVDILSELCFPFLKGAKPHSFQWKLGHDMTPSNKGKVYFNNWIYSSSMRLSGRCWQPRWNDISPMISVTV